MKLQIKECFVVCNLLDLMHSFEFRQGKGQGKLIFGSVCTLAVQGTLTLAVLKWALQLASKLLVQSLKLHVWFVLVFFNRIINNE